MNLATIALFVMLVACSTLSTASLMERVGKSLVLPRPQADARKIYLHSGTINTLKDKDLRSMDEISDDTHHFQYLVHVNAVNPDYTQRITAQIEEWSGKMVYL
jgi:hypothetical protein